MHHFATLIMSKKDIVINITTWKYYKISFAVFIYNYNAQEFILLIMVIVYPLTKDIHENAMMYCVTLYNEQGLRAGSGSIVPCHQACTCVLQGTISLCIMNVAPANSDSKFGVGKQYFGNSLKVQIFHQFHQIHSVQQNPIRWDTTTPSQYHHWVVWQH